MRNSSTIERRVQRFWRHSLIEAALRATKLLGLFGSGLIVAVAGTGGPARPVTRTRKAPVVWSIIVSARLLVALQLV